MSRSLNKATLIGHVGNAPDVRTLANGAKVAAFSVATSVAWTDASGTKQEKTEWHRCSAWNMGKQTLADVAERFVQKGDRVYVEGQIEYRTFTDKEGIERTATEIKVRELILLGSKGSGSVRPAEPATPVTPVTPLRVRPVPVDRPVALVDDDDDLPF
jgi:single-strand DNA-binding protein